MGMEIPIPMHIPAQPAVVVSTHWRHVAYLPRAAITTHISNTDSFYSLEYLQLLFLSYKANRDTEGGV